MRVRGENEFGLNDFLSSRHCFYLGHRWSERPEMKRLLSPLGKQGQYIYEESAGVHSTGELSKTHALNIGRRSVELKTEPLKTLEVKSRYLKQNIKAKICIYVGKQ